MVFFLANLAEQPITAAQVQGGFHALSDPIRLQVLQLLQDQELCVCDLCEILQISQSKLSFHLKTLRDAQLVNARQQGRWIYYSLNSPRFQLLQRFLNQLVQMSTPKAAPPCAEDA
ncbi:MAG: metalloregulator ArsR/SmtB family transcription factor [Thermostichus sp. DG_1_6_bins_120]